MDQATHIVCVGKDAHVLGIRCKVLATRFETSCVLYPGADEASALKETDAPSELMVLCHSLSREECNRLAERYRQTHPGAPVLSISAPGRYATADDSDAIVAALAGPDRLLNETERLLQRRPTASASYL